MKTWNHLKMLPLLLGVLVAGCQTQPEPSQSPSTTQSMTVSNGGYTWKLGAVTLDGTNVPLSALQVRPN